MRTVHRLTEWRDKVLMGAESALKERERDARDEEIARLQAKVGTTARYTHVATKIIRDTPSPFEALKDLNIENLRDRPG